MGSLQEIRNKIAISENIRFDAKNKKPNSKLKAAFVSLLVISLIANTFLGISLYNYKIAYEALVKSLAEKEALLSQTRDKLTNSESQLTSERLKSKQLENDINEAIQLLAKYGDENLQLKERNATKQIPKDYYTGKPSGGNKSSKELSDFLNFEFSLPKEYTRNVFDCSESAAFLEWTLQNNGFDAKIAVGPTPFDEENTYHAWVIVMTSDDYRIVVEPTALTGGFEKYLEGVWNVFNSSIRGVVYYDEKNIVSKNYYDGYDALYEDIYEAVSNYKDIEEWNWWEGVWGFK